MRMTNSTRCWSRSSNVSAHGGLLNGAGGLGLDRILARLPSLDAGCGSRARHLRSRDHFLPSHRARPVVPLQVRPSGPKPPNPGPQSPPSPRRPGPAAPGPPNIGTPLREIPLLSATRPPTRKPLRSAMR